MKKWFLRACNATFFFSLLAFFLASQNVFFIFLMTNILVWGLVLGSSVPLYLERKTANAGIGAVFLFFLLSFMVEPSDFMMVLAQFLIVVQLLRIFHFRKILYTEKPDPFPSGEYYQLYFITLVEFAVTAISTVDLVFAPLFISFLLISPIILMIFNFQRETELRGISLPFSLSPLLMGFLGGFLILFTLVPFFFFLLPRVPQGMLGSSYFRKTQITGFSENVDLDDLGYILENPQVVMRVRFLDSPPSEEKMLLKGSTYEVYENRQWKADSAFHRISSTRGRKNHFSIQKFSPELKRIRQEIYINPSNLQTLFAIAPLSEIQFLGDHSFRALLSYKNGWLKLFGTISQPIGYVATTVENPEERHFLDNRIWWIPEVNRKFPSSLNLKMFRDLAIKITEGKKTSKEKTQAIQTYLKKNYRYTLNIPDSQGREPLENFLFNSKEGHCEFFASSMIFLLRSLKIPARLVNGFRCGEYNPMGKYFVIRQKDAHAWVEVYLGKDGWVTMDPTPARQMEAPSSWKEWNLFVDYMQMKWIMSVVQYDSQEQLHFFQQIKASLRSFLHWLKEQKIVFGGGKDFFFALLLFSLFWGVLLYWKKKKRKERQSQSISSWILKRLLYLLSSDGYVLSSQETLQEFSHRILREKPHYQPIQELVVLYHRDRFGPSPLDSTGQKRSLELLEELEKAKVTSASPQ